MSSEGDAGIEGREPDGRWDLEFEDQSALEHVDDEIVRDLSALALVDRTLFCACDETSTVERLLWDAEARRFGRHRNVPLGELFELPGGPDGEMDIEGLAIADGYLWVTGSHAIKRSGLEEGDSDLSTLEETERDPNRSFFGCVPLLDRGDGEWEVVGAYEPVGGEERRAACMKMKGDEGRTILRDLLTEDPLIGPFVGLPCKENGLDIEGLAVLGDRVWLGLRGPVIGGFALLVELEVKRTKGGWIKPRKRFGGQRYRLVAIPLDGLGVRDLLIEGDRMLVLAGPTTDIEGAQSVYAAPIPDPEDSPAVADADVDRIIDLPVRRGVDHAEGLASSTINGHRRLVVGYDAPRDGRLDPDSHRITLDLYDLPASD